MKFEQLHRTPPIQEPSPERPYMPNIPGLREGVAVLMENTYEKLLKEQNNITKFINETPTESKDPYVVFIQGLAACAGPAELWKLIVDFRQAERGVNKAEVDHAYYQYFVHTIQWQLPPEMGFPKPGSLSSVAISEVSDTLHYELVSPSQSLSFEETTVSLETRIFLARNGLQAQDEWSSAIREQRYSAKELETGMIQCGSWVRSLEETLQDSGYEEMMKRLSNILFEDCGYAAKPAIYDRLPAWLKQRWPLGREAAVADSWINIGAYKKGNCQAKSTAAAILLDEVGRTLARAKKRSWKIYNHNLFRLKNAPKAAEAFSKKGYMTVSEVGQLNPQTVEQELPLVASFEEHLTGQTNTLGIGHVRRIVRLQHPDSGQVKYYVLEPDDSQPIQDWSPQSDGCYRSRFNKVKDNINIFALICHDFTLPADFRFRVKPLITSSGGGLNWFRSTIDEPNSTIELIKRHVQENIVAAVQSLPLELIEAIASLNINPHQERSFEVAQLQRAETAFKAQLTSAGPSSLIEKLFDYTERYPFIPVAAAFTGVCMGLANNQWEPDMQKALDATAHTGADILQADQGTTAAFAYLAEQSTSPAQWESDLNLAQPLLPKLASGLDLVWSGSIHDGKLTSSTEPSGDKIKQLQIGHAPDQHTTINVQLGSAIQTVEPSFWIPVLRQMASETGEYTISIQGDQLDTTAVASSFTTAWNKLDHRQVQGMTNLSLSINDHPILAAEIKDQKIQNRSFDEHFMVEPSGTGKILPTFATSKAAWQECKSHQQELPSEWRTGENAPWIAPLCKD